MIIPLYALDEMMVKAIDSDEFQNFSNALIGSELSIYVDADLSEMAEKSNYIYIANFKKLEDKEERREEYYNAYIDVVITRHDSVTVGRVTKKEDKKKIELLSLKAIEVIDEALNFDGLEWVDVNGEEQETKDLRLLGLVSDIGATKKTKDIKLILSLTFGNTDKTLGVCK